MEAKTVYTDAHKCSLKKSQLSSIYIIKTVSGTPKKLAMTH